MAFVAAKCTQCGANIEVDDTKDAGICQHCGTAFVTEKVINNYNTYITNNNNFYGANVTVQNNEKIDGLLYLAKKAILSENYELAIDYLDEIIIKSAENISSIISLFEETGVYEIVEKSIESQEYCGTGNEYILADMLEKFDSENIRSWLFMWKVARGDYVKEGKNIIRLAKEEEKATYEKEVYSFFVERGPRGSAYKECLGSIPLEYIRNNKYIQDLLIEQTNSLWDHDEEERIAIIEYIKSILPIERVNEIKIVPRSTSSYSGCYIATCVYGSYDCPQVWTLRRFRDYTLGETWYGRFFIKCYYATSPTLVKWFGETKWFRSFWKERLDKMVFRLNEKGVDNTYYNDRH